MKYPLHVVTNLEVSHVTWANAFCEATQKAGAQISNPSEVPAEAPALYIGDSIDWSSVPQPATAAYFLAAADGTDQERINVDHAVFTTTPSRPERERTCRLLGGNAVFADGFPLDLNELEAVKAAQGNQNAFVVGFVGRTEADKGPTRELAIAALLAAQGIRAVHLSATPNLIGSELTALGVTVEQTLNRSEYISRLATLGCLINTSPRESLFVSGIEATYLGVPVIAPQVAETGIADWNKPEWFYEPDEPETALHLIANIASGNSDVPDVSFYDATKYLERLQRHFEELEGARL